MPCLAHLLHTARQASHQQHNNLVTGDKEMLRAESVKLDDMVLQGSEEMTNVKLDLAELGPTDLVLVGNGWSIPVHRYNKRCYNIRISSVTVSMVTPGTNSLADRQIDRLTDRQTGRDGINLMPVSCTARYTLVSSQCYNMHFCLVPLMTAYGMSAAVQRFSSLGLACICVHMPPVQSGPD